MLSELLEGRLCTVKAGALFLGLTLGVGMATGKSKSDSILDPFLLHEHLSSIAFSIN